ncbi:MAG TPA: hypothetical protein VKE98_11100 [Gemmataceae bacterium]|nr:hypothetical protein [Gemmataceae bacterium]
MKRKLKWLAIVLAVSLLGFRAALLLWPRDRITAESWHKIRIGMTEKEVAEMLGGPGMFWKETLLSIFPMRVFLTVSAIGLAGDSKQRARSDPDGPELGNESAMAAPPFRPGADFS